MLQKYELTTEQLQKQKIMVDNKTEIDIPRRSSRLLDRTTMSRARPEATLLGIPIEIRLMIFGNLLPSVSSKDRVPRPVCHNSSKHDCALSTSATDVEPRGYLALLLVCRTIYNEAADALYKPIMRPEGTESSMAQTTISSDAIRLTNFPGMFCRNHQAYRAGTAGVFQRIKELHISIFASLEWGMGCVCCGEWHSMFDDDGPQTLGLDDKSQAIDNVRWLAEQLRGSRNLKHLTICVDWDYDLELWDNEPKLEDSASLLKPFKSLRNIDELTLSSLGTFVELVVENGDLDESNIAEWEEIVTYKTKMKDILGSNAALKENPIPLPTWLSFKQTVNRLTVFAPQVDTQKYLRQAASAVADQDKPAFQKAANSLFKEWREEKKQRQKIDLKFSEVRHAKLLDVPSGKRREDDPEGMDFSKFSWSDPSIERADRAAYIRYLEGINKADG